MRYELREIKQLRKRANLTQSQLAGLAGLSQSLIAKVESGNVDASYTKIKKIFEALESVGREHEMKSGEIMSQKIFSIAKSSSVNEAVRKMKAHSISQLPVISGDNVTGLITEKDIIMRLDEGKDPAKLSVEEVQQSSPPTVSGNTPLSAVTELLKHVPVVLVSEEGKLKGIITKADILNSIYKRRS